MIKVSILVPVYNVEGYIVRCARSLFEQTYPNVEFVFVDDCTPDRSVALLRQVMEEFPKRKSSVTIIKHEKNRGLAAARNTAMDNAVGEFVVCVDADDWLEPNAIEMLVGKQLQTGGADVVSCCRLVHEFDGKRLSPVEDCRGKEEMVIHMMHWTGDQYACGRLIRRELFVENGVRWIEGLDNVEDRYIMTQVAYYANNYAVIEVPLYHYERRNISSITHSARYDDLKYLKSSCQAVSNYVALESFFSDKECVFLEECKRCIETMLKENGLVSMVKECVEKTLVDSNKKDFFRVVGVIDSYEKVHVLLDWQLKKDGLKGVLLHDYYYMKLYLLLREVKRFVRKTIRGKNR